MRYWKIQLNKKGLRQEERLAAEQVEKIGSGLEPDASLASSSF